MNFLYIRMPFLFTPNANMYIDQYNGIIGIGTNTPTSNLHIIGSSLITGNLNVSGFTSISNVSFSSSVSLTGLTVTGAGITGILNTSSQPNITFIGTLSNLFVNSGFNVSTTGNVGIGIGTAVSNSNIHVQGTSKFLSSTGSTGLYVNTLGNIGIGTEVPQANLHVIGHTRLLNNLNNTGLYVHTNGNVGIGTSTPASNLHVLGYSQILNSAGTTGLYISSTGNVGIGTSVPLCNLHVFTGLTTIPTTGGVAANIGGPLVILHGTNDSNRFISALDTNMSTSTARWIGFGQSAALNNQAEFGFNYIGNNSNNNYLSLGLYARNNLYITGSGNVGIGITNASYPLDVSGTINTNSNYLRNGLSLAFGVFTPIVTSNFAGGTDFTWSTVFATNLSLPTTSVIQLPQQGVYKFEIILNFTATFTAPSGILMYYSNSSGGTFNQGQGYDNGLSSGTGNNTSFLYTFLYSTTYYYNCLFVKFYYNVGSTTISLDVGPSTIWSRMQIYQIV